MNEQTRKLLSVLLEESVNNPNVAIALEEAAGMPVILEAKNGAKAIDLSWLLKLLNNPALISLILAILTGGFTPALIPVLIQFIAKLFGVSESEAQAMLASAQLPSQ